MPSLYNVVPAAVAVRDGGPACTRATLPRPVSVEVMADAAAAPAAPAKLFKKRILKKGAPQCAARRRRRLAAALRALTRRARRPLRQATS